MERKSIPAADMPVIHIAEELHVIVHNTHCELFTGGLVGRVLRMCKPYVAPVEVAVPAVERLVPDHVELGADWKLVERFGRRRLHSRPCQHHRHRRA